MENVLSKVIAKFGELFSSGVQITVIIINQITVGITRTSKQKTKKIYKNKRNKQTNRKHTKTTCLISISCIKRK